METLVYSVKQLNKNLRALLETSYQGIWVTGEVSTLATPNSGHLYFSLKEDNAVIRCAFFRNRQRKKGIKPTEGMQILAYGQVSYYESRGDLQFVVSYLEESGEGVLRRAFEQLKQKLSDEGLFQDEFKSNLPKFPKTVGIVTSETGAALQDIVVTLKRRFPLAHVIVYPATVQGSDAPASIISAIDLAEKHDQAEVLIIARGGGSLEDLQAFNEEIVARRIFSCTIPTVSAVGHEIDFTICDFIADRRAPTPTAAAEMATPDIAQIRELNTTLQQNLTRQTERTLRDFRQYLDYIYSRVLHPTQMLSSLKNQQKSLTRRIVFLTRSCLVSPRSQLDKNLSIMLANSPDEQIRYAELHLTNKHSNLVTATKNKIEFMQQELGRLQKTTVLMSPQHTLDRGYAIVQNRTSYVITDPEKIQPGEPLTVLVSKGQFNVTVENKDAK